MTVGGGQRLANPGVCRYLGIAVHLGLGVKKTLEGATQVQRCDVEAV